MNAIRGTILKSKLPSLFATCSKRGAAYWNKDFMPGPYPKTPEERAAAAKKYGLLPEEYDFNPEGNGDYPMLPNESGASKSDYYNWDHPHLKKDWGEPMHIWANILSEDRFDINQPEKQTIHPNKQFLIYLSILIGAFIPFWVCKTYNLNMSLPHAKQHFPSDGPHYKYPSQH